MPSGSSARCGLARAGGPARGEAIYSLGEPSATASKEKYVFSFHEPTRFAIRQISLDHLAGLRRRFGFRKITPRAPASSMNSMPLASRASLISCAVVPLPPIMPPCASSRLMVCTDFPDDSASWLCDQPNKARAALICTTANFLFQDHSVIGWVNSTIRDPD